MNADLILHERVGSVAIITLNRPERHNSLVPQLLREMLETLAAIKADDTVRAVVLQANGHSFSTGGDAKGFVDHADNIEAYAREIVGLLNQVILALVDLPVPVITAVHGIVTGGSLGFVLGSDIVLMAPEASLTPFYSVVGPSPDGGWAGLLPLLIGRRRAAEVLYLNETIEAETAVSWGLANRVVPANEIRQAALIIAQAIADKKQGSIRRTRQLLHWHRDEIAARLAAELEHFVDEMANGEGLTGFQAFLEQRHSEIRIPHSAFSKKGLAIGQEASTSRIFTAEDVAAYRALTGDVGLRFGASDVETAVPGPLLAGIFSDILGTTLPGRGTNWLKQQLQFPTVAQVGDVITGTIKITRLRPDKQLVNLQAVCTNSAGTILCKGETLVIVSDLEKK